MIGRIIPKPLALSTFAPRSGKGAGGGSVRLEFVAAGDRGCNGSFLSPQHSVDVRLFDESGRYVTTCRAELTDPTDGHRMSFDGDLPFGKYTMLTLSGLCEPLQLVADDNEELVPGVTTIDTVSLRLHHNGIAARDLSDMWFGPAAELHYSPGMSAVRVPLVCQTNRFNVVMQHIAVGVRVPSPSYTIEIVAPEAGAYNHRNEPIVPEPVLYRPTRRESRFDSLGTEYLTAVTIHTMRLLASESGGYRMIVCDAETGAGHWSFDLLDLLRHSKPDRRPDGTPLSMQDYFDCENEWNMVIIHGCGANDGFAPLGVIVNGKVVREF